MHDFMDEIAVKVNNGFFLVCVFLRILVLLMNQTKEK